MVTQFLITFAVVQPRQEIEITLPDGSKRQGKSWETSPMDVAKEISKGLADRIVIAKVCSLILFEWFLFSYPAAGEWRSLGSRETAGRIMLVGAP